MACPAGFVSGIGCASSKCSRGSRSSARASGTDPAMSAWMVPIWSRLHQPGDPHAAAFDGESAMCGCAASGGRPAPRSPACPGPRMRSCAPAVLDRRHRAQPVHGQPVAVQRAARPASGRRWTGRRSPSAPPRTWASCATPAVMFSVTQAARAAADPHRPQARQIGEVHLVEAERQRRRRCGRRRGRRVPVAFSVVAAPPGWPRSISPGGFDAAPCPAVPSAVTVAATTGTADWPMWASPAPAAASAEVLQSAGVGPSSSDVSTLTGASSAASGASRRHQPGECGRRHRGQPQP